MCVGGGAPPLTDNGRNIVAAFRSDMAVTLHDNEEDESDDEEDEDYDESDFDLKERDYEVTFSFKRVSSFAHTLQLVVNKFDEAATFKDAIKRSHRLSQLIHLSVVKAWVM